MLLFSALAHAAVPLSSFNTVIAIQHDGSVVVVERFRPESSHTTVFWSTRTELPGAFGIRNPRLVEILEVTTSDGRPLSYKVRNPIGRLELKVSDPDAKEVRLVYSVRNAVQFLNDRDELLWVAGEGWRGDTRQASLFVQAPPEAAGTLRAQAYLRGHGFLMMRPSDSAPGRIWFEAINPIRRDQELLLDVVLPKGELQQPDIGTRFGWFVSANTIVLLPVATLAFMLLLRKLKRLPDAPEYSVAPQYEPPQEMSPAEIGVLIDDKLDPRDITATFLDLAIRGFIRLEECHPDPGTVFRGQDYKLVSLRPRDEWYGLCLHERTLLFHTFYGGEWTKLSSLCLRFYPVVPLVRQHVIQLLRRKRMYWTDPAYAGSARISMLMMFFGAAIVIQLLGIFSFANSLLLSLISVAISAAIVYYFGRTITAKTRRGLRTYEKIRGFQVFLDTVESDRLKRLPADLFEKWLPHAMALGVEHHWVSNFEGVALPQFDWTAGLEEKVFDTDGLIRSLSTVGFEPRLRVRAAAAGGMRGRSGMNRG